MNVLGPDEGWAGAPAPEVTPRSITSVLKRVVDIVVSGLALVLTAPIILVAALAIRVDSTGPVIIRQARVGRDGIPFELYRFRTTIYGTAELTRIGRFLRWSSIDELPHLWNVLRGHMSLVGPPPAIPIRRAEGPSAGDAHRIRPVPGLTGTWGEAVDWSHGREPRSLWNQSEPSEQGGSDNRAG